MFQGRYKAILVQKEAHLLELSRYVVLNPVRAGMTASPADWPWSSDAFCATDQFAPPWLDTNWLLGQFGSERSKARKAYVKFVREGIDLPSPLLATKHQLLLGDQEFVEQHQHELQQDNLREVSMAHRRSLALSLQEYAESSVNRNEAMAQAYRSGAYTMAEIAAYFDVHYMTVSRAVRAFEKDSS